MPEWLETQRIKRAEEVSARWPEMEPGWFVQSVSWFGDVWAEVLAVSRVLDHPKWWSVTCVRYGKYGDYRKVDNLYLSDVRRFGHAGEIERGKVLLYERDRYTRWGEPPIVWPSPINRHQFREKRLPALAS